MSVLVIVGGTWLVGAAFLLAFVYAATSGPRSER